MGDWKKLYSTIFRRERVEKKKNREIRCCLYFCLNRVYKAWSVFHSAQYSLNFGWKSNGKYPFSLVRLTGIFECTNKNGLLWPVLPVRPEFLFPFAKLLSLVTFFCISLNQMRGGSGRFCAAGIYRSNGHMEFPNSTRNFFLNGKRPKFLLPPDPPSLFHFKNWQYHRKQC